VRYHTGNIGKRLIIDINVKKLNEPSKARGILRRHKFAFLQYEHLFIYLLYQKPKLLLIAELVVIKFSDPLPQSNHQILNQIIVLGLLLSCSEATVNTHYNKFIIRNNNL